METKMKRKLEAHLAIHLMELLLFLMGLKVAIAGTPKPKQMPEFLEPVPNMTVALGRSATLPCIVRNLQDYKVAFIHIDRQMILTIHKQVITRIPRFTITHDSHLTWSLHIDDVRIEDKGYYMCQVNTDPMVSTIGFLDVVVPPQIVDAESSPSTVSVRENNNASLICKSNGIPEPKITWMREDGKKIILKRRKKEGKMEKKKVHGETLDLIRISRTEMGAYLCIASNGIPPSISKRIILTVEFPPMVWIPNQLVGAPLGTDVKLECHTESSPKAISYWVFNGVMVLDTPRFRSEEQIHSEYKLDSRLHIQNLQKEDFGPYKCITKNSLGETEGSIMLYELEAATEPALDSTLAEDGYPSYEEDSYADGSLDEEQNNRLESSESDSLHNVSQEDEADESNPRDESFVRTPSDDPDSKDNSQNRYFSYESDLFRKGNSGLSSNFRNRATPLGDLDLSILLSIWTMSWLYVNVFTTSIPT